VKRLEVRVKSFPLTLYPLLPFTIYLLPHMEILISNKLAALKQNTSFEYISENRLFSGSDDYTLSITFPLKDCAQNLAIFGNIHRADVDKSKVRFDCEIRDRSFYKFGTITITEISDTEVKTQFLEGRSEQKFRRHVRRYLYQ